MAKKFILTQSVPTAFIERNRRMGARIAYEVDARHAAAALGQHCVLAEKVCLLKLLHVGQVAQTVKPIKRKKPRPW